MADPVSKSQAKRLKLEGVQATCWFIDGVCPDCGATTLATDGRRTWCFTRQCLDPEGDDGR